jgi:hypothetical protein
VPQEVSTSGILARAVDDQAATLSAFVIVASAEPSGSRYKLPTACCSFKSLQCAGFDEMDILVALGVE